MGFRLSLVVAGLLLARGYANLFGNPDFESSEYTDNWYCREDCCLVQDDDAYSGEYSVLVTDRTESWDGLAQNVSVEAGEIYIMTVYVKLLDVTEGNFYEYVRMTLACVDQEGEWQYDRVGITPYAVPGQWVEVGGVLRIKDGYSNCLLYVETESPVDYLADQARVIHVPNDDDWKVKANERINEFRKTDITLNVKLTGCGSPGETTVELTQTQMDFPFGTAVDATKIVESAYQAYQTVFYENFNWGVLENKLKWRLMEWDRGNIDYNTPMTAMEAMIAKGIKTRCHCTFWGKYENVQYWVQELYGEQMLTAIEDRIQGVINQFKGMCEHWDVNNENLHGHVFEDHTGDVNITMKMFQKINAIDSHAELYINDFDVVSGEGYTVALKDQAVRFLKAGVPIGGVGIQGHLHTFDVQLIKARIDVVAEAGLPIMITEFAINDENVTSKAQRLEDILTLLYSLKSIKGVIFWGYWDGQIWEPNGALYNGDSCEPNAAGLVYERLYHETWRTKVVKTVTKSQTFTVRSFKGPYTLTFKRNDVVLKSVTFNLSDQAKKIVARVGTSGKVTVQIN